MPYRLHDDLSYCEIDGHLVFLDVLNDRYFRLPPALERTFVAHRDGEGATDSDVAALVDRDILVDAQGTAGGHVAPPIERPVCSAVEQTSTAPPVPLPMLAAVDVFRIVLATQLQLKRRGLKRTLDTLSSYRETSTLQTPAGAPADQQFLEAAAQFRRVRPYVPIETRCLLDSLSLTRFLAKRRLHATLVFGVTAEPFSAHCWVQAGRAVLNDTLGNVCAHTPIRAI
ncbi:lasso peptide biosynthesis B2 protein [Luteimonas sp. BDR2-5]|uniref:lasso peptide biosynthesis B2 protein n=1 Tax=Proluteimonas luteida TaxID=2878685 RepID=UPI001E370BAC|nr:lasso peptide biosynthesis B2 protein [Luteimonas sp. BDR2-5]MCD9026766.1 lasso peptide biosynthesis B2 protein [Luteimonas sp. BDR2-5]